MLKIGILFSSIALAIVAPITKSADIYVVTPTDSDWFCSLPNAIKSAVSDTSHGGCISGNGSDRILLIHSHIFLSSPIIIDSKEFQNAPEGSITIQPAGFDGNWGAEVTSITPFAGSKVGRFLSFSNENSSNRRYITLNG